MKNIKAYAEKEMIRMTVVFKKIKIVKGSQAKHFFEFASNYLKDGVYFLKKKMFIESFEAIIIAWAYIDCGLKLDFFSIPKELKKDFTVD